MKIHTCPIKTARQVARELIEVYVLRGDRLDSFTNMARCCLHNEAEIGFNQKYGQSQIVVTTLNQKECEYVFSKKEIYEEIKSGQLSLI